MVLMLLFSYSCKDIGKAKQPQVIKINTEGSVAKPLGCFTQIKNLDTLEDKNDKSLKRYFNSMVPAPSRSSLFVKRK